MTIKAFAPATHAELLSLREDASEHLAEGGALMNELTVQLINNVLNAIEANDAQALHDTNRFLLEMDDDVEQLVTYALDQRIFSAAQATQAIRLLHA